LVWQSTAQADLTAERTDSRVGNREANEALTYEYKATFRGASVFDACIDARSDLITKRAKTIKLVKYIFRILL